MHFDGIIIGSGQAGNPLAERLSKEGWKVALIERGNLGGTCVNVGCTPTKTLAHRAQIAHYARESSRWGVKAENVSVDFAAVMSQKRRIVKEWRDSVAQGLEASENLRVIRGEARFVGPKQIEVNGERLTSERFFIDTGGEPLIPDVLGLGGTPFLTNESILELEALPKSLIVIGGGYIGLEFAQMFHRFGSSVTILQRGGQLVPKEDPEVAQSLQESLEGEGINVVLRAEIEQVEYAGGFQVKLPTGPVAASHLLVATGRRPNTNALDLELTGIRLGKGGYIPVNEKLETEVSGIWAVGDVNGGPAFTHISYNDYQILCSNLLDGKAVSTKERIVPYCVFTDPQLGGFGLNEKQARMQGFTLKVGSIPMSSVARAVERDESAGLMKLVVDGNTDQVLGATVLGVEGGEVVQILMMVALAKQPYTLLKEAIFIHPTIAEGLFRLVESVK